MPPVAHRRRLRRVARTAALPILTIALWLTAAGPTVACSCMGPKPMAAYGQPENAVFAGVAGPPDARGVPVQVTTWYHGAGAAPIVYLAKGSFSDSSSCGISTPVMGSSWIWVTWISGGSDLQTGLCDPHAVLGTPEGNAMVVDAEATFGGAPPPGAAIGKTEAPPGPPLPPDAAPLILGATIGLGVVILGVVALLALRRPRSA